MAARQSAKPAFADVADREPTWRHNSYVDWLTEQTGVDVDPKSVQLATTLYKSFVDSDHYAQAQQAQADAKQAAAEAKAEAQRQKVLDRAAKLKAQADEILARAGVTDEVGAKRAAKKVAPAKKAAPAKPPAPPRPPVVSSDDSDDEDGF